MDDFADWACMPRASIRIVAVTQFGDVANVVLVWQPADDPGDAYLDLHNLIRVDGVWKITNKTATHLSRAGAPPK